MLPPQMRKPNVSTEAVGSWNSKSTTKRFERKEKDKVAGKPAR